jgi:hypothetical protein
MAVLWYWPPRCPHSQGGEPTDPSGRTSAQSLIMSARGDATMTFNAERSVLIRKRQCCKSNGSTICPSALKTKLMACRYLWILIYDS